jgi:hypothetical protein
MGMTRQSKSQLDTLFADNILGEISAGDLRDFVDSTYVIGGTTATTVTATTAPVSIEAGASQGVISTTFAPSSATSELFGTGLMRKAIVSTAGGAWSGVSHGVAGYDYMVIEGNNNSAQQFVHEAKLKVTGSGTHGHVVLYKPAIDDIAGTVTKLTCYDCEMDTSGISGTIGELFSIHAPRTYSGKALLSNGLMTHAEFLFADKTLTENDSGCLFATYGASGTEPVEITVPASLRAGCTFRVMRLGTGVVTVVASGGNAIYNKSGAGYNKISDVLGVITIEVFSSGSGGAVILSGDVGN